MPERLLPYQPPELDGLDKPSRVERGRRRGESVPGHAVHSRMHIDRAVADEPRDTIVETGPKGGDDLESIHREYNETYQLLEILLTEHPDITRPIVPFDGRDIPLDKALRLIDAEITHTVAQYEASEGQESDNTAALGNIKGALSEITQLKEIFLTAVAKHEEAPDEPAELSKDVEGENDAEKQALSILEADYKKWEGIRGRINELTNDRDFRAAMESLPVPNFAKKHEHDGARGTINRWKRVLEQGKTPNKDLQSKIDLLKQNLAQMVPAAEVLLARLETQSKKGDALISGNTGTELDGAEETEGVPIESLERADTLLARWDELGKEIGTRRIIALLREKYPEPEYTLPHVREIQERVKQCHDPKVWSGRLAERNRRGLAEDLEQLVGIVGDAEKIAAEIREKEASAQSEEGEFKNLSVEDGIEKLRQLLVRWEELKGSYGDTELREMMFQDRGPEFPPLKDITDWLAKQSKKSKWKLQDEELLRYDALPKMTGFIARAEAAAKKLQPKKRVEKKPAPEEKGETGTETKANVFVLTTGRAVESGDEITAWEKLLPKEVQSFKEEILIRQTNAFQKRIREKLLARGIEHSVDRSRTAKAALEVFMPARIRQLAKERNIEITDEEIEKTFMVSLRKNLLVS